MASAQTQTQIESVRRAVKACVLMLNLPVSNHHARRGPAAKIGK
jgi:hypothetical protein